MYPPPPPPPSSYNPYRRFPSQQPQQSETFGSSPQSNESSGVPLWVWVVTAVFAFTAFGLAVAGYVLAKDNRTNFKGVSPFSSPILIDQKTLLVPCSNLTLEDTLHAFKGSTEIAMPCQETGNDCSVNLCGTDGYCHIELAENATCHRDDQCGLGFQCRDCACTPSVFINTTCEADINCPVIEGNPCLETACIDNTCVTNLTMGAECSSSTSCANGFSCNSTCMCVPSSIEVDTYDAVLTNFGDNDTHAFDFESTVSLVAYFKDYGDWIEVSIEAELTPVEGNNLTTVSFDFSLPTLSDTDNGSGTFVTAPEDGLFADAGRKFPAVGHVFRQSASVGRVSAPIINPDYVGNSINVTYETNWNLLYKKA